MKILENGWLDESELPKSRADEEIRQELNNLKKILLAQKPNIELAILANGGSFKKEWCECDPETNNCPCQYCAIYSALKNILEIINMKSYL